MMVKPRRVLVVDDDVDAVDDLRHALGPHHVYVTQATDAAQAKMMTALQSWRFDAVIMQTRLLDGDGFALCATLRRFGFQRPILMLSDADLIADVARGLDAGADDYLVKPYSVTSLLARLNAHIANKVYRQQSGIFGETG
jgi:two-component system, OmpR family, response regulator